MNNIQNAEKKFIDGYACSQAVLCQYSQDFSLDPKIATKISSGFGGGMRMARTCGAVTGAFMVLGLKFGGEDSATPKGREIVYEAVIDFTVKFTALNGSTECKDLLCVDISTKPGMQAAKEQKLFQTRCPKFIRDSVSILEQMLNNDKTDR